MTQVFEPSLDRFERAKVDKFETRRGELADAALETLGELGYARTSLREIARRTAFSHGVLHYYFRDKVELVTYCVRRYKEHCVSRYDDLVAAAGRPEDLEAGFGDAMVETMLADTAMHRLWYDMRAQAMFEDVLLPTVVDLDRQLQDMVWRVVSRHAQLSGVTPTISPETAYALFDGLFENSLVRHLAGDGAAGERLRSGSRLLLTRLVA